MDFLEYIKTIDEDELIVVLDELINNLESDSKRINNCDYFGFNVSSDIKSMVLDDSVFHLNMKSMYDGYIPLDTKVIYGFSINEKGLISNKGMYYKVDDDSYIYDFCKYIKDINVINTEDFFEYVLLFLKNYFGTFKFNERDDMFKMILKDEKNHHDPVKEHRLSKFKGKGNALCSEYSILANNILNVFGIYSCVMMGQLELTSKAKEGHAFNLVSFMDNDTNERVNALIDFSNGVNVYDFSYRKLGDSPYILYIDSIEDTVNSLICDDSHITCSEYDYMLLGNSLLQMFTDRERDYSSCSNLTVNIQSKVKQK